MFSPLLKFILHFHSNILVLYSFILSLQLWEHNKFDQDSLSELVWRLDNLNGYTYQFVLIKNVWLKYLNQKSWQNAAHMMWNDRMQSWDYTELDGNTTSCSSHNSNINVLVW